MNIVQPYKFDKIHSANHVYTDCDYTADVGTYYKLTETQVFVGNKYLPRYDNNEIDYSDFNKLIYSYRHGNLYHYFIVIDNSPYMFSLDMIIDLNAHLKAIMNCSSSEELNVFLSWMQL